MSQKNISQIVIVNAQKIGALEDRLNEVLGDLSVDRVVSIDYMYEPDTYGMLAIVRYLASESE